MLAVWAGCLVNAGVLLLGLGLRIAAGRLVFATTFFSGEVDTALWVETGDVGCVCGEEMLGDGCVPSVCRQCLYTVRGGCYLRRKEGL